MEKDGDWVRSYNEQPFANRDISLNSYSQIKPTFQELQNSGQMQYLEIPKVSVSRPP